MCHSFLDQRCILMKDKEYTEKSRQRKAL